MFCFSFYKWVSQRHTLLIESSSFFVLIGNLISISSPFFHRKTLIRFHQVLFYRVHQFFVCCDDEAAADDAPYDVVVDDWVILDPSAPYDVDVVVFDWRRIASELDNPLPLRWIGVRVLSKEIIFFQMFHLKEIFYVIKKPAKDAIKTSKKAAFSNFKDSLQKGEENMDFNLMDCHLT